MAMNNLLNTANKVNLINGLNDKIDNINKLFYNYILEIMKNYLKLFQ